MIPWELFPTVFFRVYELGFVMPLMLEQPYFFVNSASIASQTVAMTKNTMTGNHDANWIFSNSLTHSLC